MKIGPTPQNSTAGISACDTCDHKTCSGPLNQFYFPACLYRAVKCCWLQRGVREDGLTSVTSELLPPASAPQLMQHHPHPFKRGLSEMSSNKAAQGFLCLSGKRHCAERPVPTFLSTDSCQKGRSILHMLHMLQSPQREGDLEWGRGAITSRHRVRRSWGSSN